MQVSIPQQYSSMRPSLALSASASVCVLALAALGGVANVENDQSVNVMPDRINPLREGRCTTMVVGKDVSTC